MIDSDDESLAVTAKKQQKKKGKKEAEIGYQPGPVEMALDRASSALAGASKYVRDWEIEKKKDVKRVTENKEKEDNLTQRLKEIETKEKELEIRIEEVKKEAARVESDRLQLEKDRESDGYKALAEMLADFRKKNRELAQQVIDLEQELQESRDQVESSGSNSLNP